MTTVKSRVQIQMDVLAPSLAEFAGLTLAQQAAIGDGFSAKLYGDQATAVQSLLSDQFRPDIEVDAQGMATLADRWAAAQAAVAAYNDLDTGLQLVLPPADPSGDPPPPQSTVWIWRNGEWVLVSDWEGRIVEGETSRLVRNMSADATTEVDSLVVAVLHVAVEVPKSFS